jgi:hypothetical protein
MMIITVITIIILTITMILLADNNSNDDSCNDYDSISNDNNSDNSSFDVRFIGNWVSLLFHVRYFWYNSSDYWFEKFTWLNVLFYFLPYFFFNFIVQHWFLKIKKGHPGFL